MNKKLIDYDNRLFKKNTDYLTKKKNITLKYIEDRLELGHGALSKYRNPKNLTKPSIEIMMNLANFLEVTIDDLISKDLEAEDTKEIRNKERKEIVTCQKLIDETNNNRHDWVACDLLDGYVHSYGQNDIYYYDEILVGLSPDNFRYSSKFLNEDFSMDSIEGFTVDIGESTRVLILAVLLDDENNRYSHNFGYEVYFTKGTDEIYEILPLCSGYSSKCDFTNGVKFDQDIHNITEKLYETVLYYKYHGKERHKVKDICDRYLESEGANLDYIPF